MELEERLSRLSPQKLALLVRDLQRKAAQADAAAPARDVAMPMAIIGMGCRYPGGADDPARFWDMLADGGDAIGEIPADRWDWKAFYDPDPDAPAKMTTRWGGFLSDVAGFDAPFFGLGVREAAWMDPQQRLMLEVAWEALEAAGQTRVSLAGSRTGVFVGAYNHEYSARTFDRLEEIQPFSGTGVALNAIAGRISYLWDLHGPALVVDTACSSSLVALHLAAQSLERGECDMALVGGVNVLLSPMSLVPSSKMGMMAADGRCKSFDARADGVVISEGCGAILLKPLDAARRDGDPVLAVLAGTAINQDGRSNGLTAPNQKAQADVIRSALARAGVTAGDVGYVETHGTGTPLGDPIEMEALAETYGAANAPGHCRLGAVKANIGHAGAASGLAGVIKAVGCLRHGMIPPYRRLGALNPNIEIAGTRLSIVREPVSWPAGQRPRIAAVSSFGWSGTNAHVLLREAPAGAAPVAPPAGPFLLPLSARSRPALRDAVARMADWLEAAPPVPFADIVCTAGTRRTHHEYRLSVVADSHAAAASALRAILADGEELGPSEPARRRRTGFVFSGQGSQWAGMGRDLLATEPVFRAAVEQADALVEPLTGWTISAMLADGGRLEETAVAQPVLAVLQIALTRLLAHWGVAPDAVAGHSVGEIAAAHAAGLLDMAQAMRVAVHRGRVMQAVHGDGAMAAVNLPPDELSGLIAGTGLDIAAINAPASCVVAGPEGGLAALAAKGVAMRRLDVRYAFHSRSMRGLQPDLRAALDGLVSAPDGPVRLYSTLTGRRRDGQARFDAGYWADGIAAPVRFADAVAAMVTDGVELFVEVGPHAVLTRSVREILGDGPGRALATLRRDRPEKATLLSAVGELHALGAPVRLAAAFPAPRPVAALPAYPWQHRRYWVDFPPRSVASVPSSGTLPGRKLDLAGRESVHEVLVGAGTFPFLDHHRYFGRITVPAAFFLAFALSARAGSLEDVDFRAALTLEEGESRRLQLVTAADGGFRVCSADAGGGWTCHAEGRYGTARVPAAMSGGTGQSADPVAFHAFLEGVGLSLGPSYRVLSDFRIDGAAATALVDIGRTGSTPVDPLLLDACLQVIGGPDWLAAQGGDRTGLRASMPVHLKRLAVAGSLPARVAIAVAGGPAGAARLATDNVTLDVSISDPQDGRPLLSIEGFTIRRLSQEALRPEAAGLYTIDWQPTPLVPHVPPGLVLTGHGEALAPDMAAFLAALNQVKATTDPVWCRTRPDSPTDALLEGLALTAGLEDAARMGGIGEGEGLATGEQVRWRAGQPQVARLRRKQAAAGAGFVPRADRSYLVTGGQGGLGLATARWLADGGAGGLLLIGRRPGDAAMLTELSAGGCRVAYQAVDVADAAALAGALTVGLNGMAPLDGVFHAAGLLEDATIPQIDPARAAAVIAAKAGGAWALHRLTADLGLSQFVLYGSLAGLTGNAGQAAYAAANRYLDRLADWRRGQGLAATSIAWGPWAEVGMAARAGSGRAAARGLRALQPAAALAALGRVLGDRAAGPTAVIAAIDWTLMADGPALFADLLPKRPVEESHRAALAAMAPDRRRRELADLVARQAASVLGLAPGERPDPRRPLRELGLDSLAAVDLRGGLGRALSATLPAVLVFDHPTVADIASFLDTELFGAAEPAKAAAPAAAVANDIDDVLGALADLSDDDVMRALGGT
ncbi:MULTISPECIES: type I polyketide synthase [unclassified Azospirillum]|uniref:type I polyketide synthase n=1 Tax=unclassified Azospirillum TaxID=2630922 RepID=UPI000B74944C|nr:MULTISPECIES: type I polyketide synthase [unclassified Azospirillum]SNS94744.1 Acyl transferase domain-containing protein [Azospirillum sp. RU38E]SNT11215.1 Acyl transferase domain-containing protein [Azospirillum sp. RU37A]